MGNTITTKDSLRTSQVQRCQRHQVAQRRRQCRHALCTQLVVCNHTTPHTHTALQPALRRHANTSTHHHCTTPSPPHPHPRTHTHVSHVQHDHNEWQLTYRSGPAMSATPACPTPAPVPPCPLREARSLQPHTTRTVLQHNHNKHTSKPTTHAFHV